MLRPHLVSSFAVLPLLAALGITAACSDESSDQEMSGDKGGAGGTGTIVLGGKSGANPGSGGSATVSGGGTTSCSLEDDGSGCVGEAYEGETIGLDIYIMFDQSGSMCSCIDPAGGQACPDPNCEQTRLDAVRSATRSFLADRASNGIGVGIGYFGKQPIGEASCDEDDYSEATVEIGLLPDQAEAINDSLSSIEPTGETPSGAAIRGACTYARAHKERNPAREVVILLLTDGKPEAPVSCMDGEGSCCPTLDDAADAARDCLEEGPGIRTYVLGVGPLLGNLEEIADAGGTEKAYLVEGGDVATEVLEALNRIRGDAIPCEFQLPPPPTGQGLVYDRVNITFANGECEPTYYSYVESLDACPAEGGWYYDDPASPQKVLLCPASCDQVSDPAGRLLFTVGCATREVPK
jgi:hypothetical protein